MLPEWSVGEQLTSAMQYQHTKEAWVIDNWQEMGCRVPRGYYTATRGLSGEFMHVVSTQATLLLPPPPTHTHTHTTCC